MESISDLPNHLVALIVQHLTVEERCRCCSVNKIFNSLNAQQQLGPTLIVRPKQVDSHTFRGCQRSIACEIRPIIWARNLYLLHLFPTLAFCGTTDTHPMPGILIYMVPAL